MSTRACSEVQRTGFTPSVSEGKSVIRRIRCLAVGLLLTVAMLGCANAQPFKGVNWTRETSVPFVEVTPVAQLDVRDCGYASMATVASYHGVPLEKLREETIVRNFANRTLSAVDLVKMAHALGLIAFGYEGSVEDLKRNLTKGRPVVVLLSNRPRIGKFPSVAWSQDTAHSFVGGPHWVVVLSATPEGQFVLHDPAQGCLVMDGKSFLKSWREKAMVCVLVGRPPKSAG